MYQSTKFLQFRCGASYGTATACILAILTASTCVITPLPARADDKKVALDLLGAAKYYYKKGEFAAAAKHFMDAYKVDPRPEFLFNAARAQQRAMKLKAAKQLYGQVLAHRPAASAAVQARTRLHLAEIKAVQVAIERARQRGQTDAEARQEQRRLAQKANGTAGDSNQRSQELQGVGGAVGKRQGGKGAPDDAEKRAAVPSAPQPSVGASAAEAAAPWAAYGLIAGGVAGLAIGGWQLMGVSSDQEALNALIADRGQQGIVGVDYQSYSARQKDINTDRKIGAIAAGMGAVAAGVGAYLWWRAGQSSAVAIAPEPGMRGFVVMMRF